MTLWSRGYARAAILGHERTMNPSAAATSILQRMKGGRAAIKKAKKRRKPFHKGNPTAAEVALSVVPGGGIVATAAKVLSSLGIGSKYTKDTHVTRFVAAQSGNNPVLAKALIDQAAAHASAQIPDAAEWAARFEAMRAQANPANLSYMNRLRKPPAAGSPAAQNIGATLLGALTQPGAIRTVASLARGGRRQARGRYPTYTDRYGRQRYSTRPPEAGEMRLPAGAVPSPGTPYSFFQGAVGKGGAGTTAGQLAVAAGAGIAAYLVTQKLLAALGGRAQKAEEAGVAAALALRQARADLVKQQGHPITPAQAKEMGAAYKAQLVQLGYDPVTFTRTRSGVENFLETYNPFGG